MSCPNRCSNDFKVKNIPDELECVVAQKIKSNEFAVRSASNEVLPFNINILSDASSGLLNDVSVATTFSGTVLRSDGTQAASGEVLKLPGDNSFIIAL